MKVEIKRMWHLDTIIIPETVEALGMICKNNDIDSENFQGNPFLSAIQKSMLMENAPVLIKSYPICSIVFYRNLH